MLTLLRWRSTFGATVSKHYPSHAIFQKSRSCRNTSLKYCCWSSCGFHSLLPGGRFVNKELGLVFELAAKLFVRFRDRLADEVLNLYRPGGTARYVEQISQKHRSPAFALAKVTHQRASEGSQSRPALSRGHSGRQAGLGGDAAAGAMATEELIFFDDGFDWRQVPDLVPLRGGTVRQQVAPTATAATGMARRDGGALFGWDEFSRVPFVTFLSALLSFLARRWLSFGLCVRMLGTRRQRRIARSQFLKLIGQGIHLPGQSIHLSGQSIDLIKQRQDKRFDSGRHLGFECWRDLAHAGIGAENATPSPDQFLDSLHRLVNGYRDR